jgi:hypothetical protein
MDARDAIEFMMRRFRDTGPPASSIRSSGEARERHADYMQRHQIDRVTELVGTVDTASRQGMDRVKELFIALDVDTLAEARQLADQLRGAVGGFKIGSQPSPATGANRRGTGRPRRSCPSTEVPRHRTSARRSGPPRGWASGCSTSTPPVDAR